MSWIRRRAPLLPALLLVGCGPRELRMDAVKNAVRDMVQDQIGAHVRSVSCPGPRAVKVGDTGPDIAEGRNAGAWSVGVTHTGSDVGCTAEEFAALAPEERRERVAVAERMLRAAGAHAVIGSAAGVPALLDELNARLARGERP